jgi:hypothetical protein
MEQRTLRLGDILDDYCPRERRVTNHAIVAMIEENVKQTRCTTCEAEHAYKGAKAPRRRKKDAGVVLYEEVLAGMPESNDRSTHTPVPPVPTAQVHMADGNGNSIDEPARQPEETEGEAPRVQVEDGPFHRRLIRATLPRPEGQKEVRQVPDFTIRHNGGRSNGHNPYRGGDRSNMRGAGANGAGNGNRPHGGGGRRFAGSGGPGGNPGMPGARGGRSNGGRPGFGGGSNQQRPGGGPSTASGRAGGRKRSR